MGGDSGYTLRVCKQKEKNQNKSGRITIYKSLVPLGWNREKEMKRERERKTGGREGEREKGKERKRKTAQSQHKFLFFNCSLALICLHKLGSGVPSLLLLASKRSKTLMQAGGRE